MTLEIGAPAAAAYLAHDDYSGSCQAAPTATPTATNTPVVTSTPVATSTPPATPIPTPATGCAALNALTADSQTNSTLYQFGVGDLDFNPGEQMHVAVAFTSSNTPSWDATIANLSMLNSYGDELAFGYRDAFEGASGTASINYVVVEGDDVDGFTILVATDGADTMTLDSVHISCTPA